MNVETYTYTIITTFIGMGIVFTFLGLLYLIMIVLTSFSKIALNRKKSNKDLNSEKENLPPWILAAVAAYLSLENNEELPIKASVWKTAKKKDEWVILHNISTKKTGTF